MLVQVLLYVPRWKYDFVNQRAWHGIVDVESFNVGKVTMSEQFASSYRDWFTIYLVQPSVEPFLRWWRQEAESFVFHVWLGRMCTSTILTLLDCLCSCQAARCNKAEEIWLLRQQ